MTEQRETAYTRALARVSELVGVELLSPMDEVRFILAGIPTRYCDLSEWACLCYEDVSWILSPQTLKRRQKEGGVLKRSESDRWLRTAKILMLAGEVFGDSAASARWLKRPLQEFDQQSPLEIMSTEPGGKLVVEMLLQIDSGYAA